MKRLKKMRVATVAGCTLVGLLTGCIPVDPPIPPPREPKPLPPPPPKVSTLTMERKNAIIDRSAVATGATVGFTSVLVLPPEGKVDDMNPYDQDIEFYNREFIRQGVKVFVSATQLGLADRVKDIIAGTVDDVTLPFEAIFQFDDYRWDVSSRLFLLNGPGGAFAEVTLADLRKEESPFLVLPFASPTLYVQGRLISVKGKDGGLPNAANAQEIASIEMALPISYFLPRNYVAEYEFTPGGAHKVTRENFKYHSDEWHAKAMEETVQRMVATVVTKLVKQ